MLVPGAGSCCRRLASPTAPEKGRVVTGWKPQADLLTCFLQGFRVMGRCCCRDPCTHVVEARDRAVSRRCAEKSIVYLSVSCKVFYVKVICIRSCLFL